MAMRFGTWAAAAALSCCVLWIGVDRYRPIKRNVDRVSWNILGTWGRTRARATTIADQLGEANDRLRLLKIRDSVEAVVKTHGDSSFAVVVDSRANDVAHAPLDSLIRAQWTSLAISPAIPTIIAIVVDDDRSPGGLPRANRYDGWVPIDAFLPSVNTNGRCVEIAHVPLTRTTATAPTTYLGRSLSTPETMKALLSPCAFFAAFGEPGTQVRNWLRDGRWISGHFAAWDANPGPWTPATYRPPPVAVWYSLFNDQTDRSQRVRQYLAPEGVACLAGEAGMCEHNVLVVPATTRDTAWRSAVVTTQGTSVFAFAYPRGTTALGPAQSWLLSEMVRTLGRDRFGEFWRSQLPVDSAFRTAAGESLDEWTRTWALRTYGSTDVGPGISIAGLGTGATVVVVGLALAVSIARRRRVA